MEIGKKYLANVYYKWGEIEKFVIIIKLDQKKYKVGKKIKGRKDIEHIDIVGVIYD